MTGRAFAKGSGRSPEPLSFAGASYLFSPLLHCGPQRAASAPENFQIGNYAEEFQTI
jgi:hypothetical protein